MVEPEKKGGNNRRQQNRPRNNKRNRQKRGIKTTTKRGPPGVLLTCEREREVKCERDGMEILRHYFDHNSHESDLEKNDNHGDERNQKEEIDKTKKKVKMTLEEELALLKRGDSAKENGSGDCADGSGEVNPFVLYETGCRGCVFLMNEIPGFSFATTNDEEKKDGDEETAASESKKIKIDKDESTAAAVKCNSKNEENADDNENTSDANKHSSSSKQNSPSPSQKSEEQQPWDPVPTVKQIIDDIRGGNNNSAPSSRFITRLIPIQATCYPETNEIKNVAKALIDTYLSPSVLAATNGTDATPSVAQDTKNDKKKESNDNNDDTTKKHTFSIVFKKRLCAHLSRDDVISAVAGLLLVDETTAATNNFKVDLTNPDYTFVIEVCRTLCCMAIVKDFKSYRNFNVMLMREEQDIPMLSNAKVGE